MGIEGKKRELKDFGKKVGLVEVSVIAINPSPEEFKELWGWEPEGDDKRFDYLGESDDGNTVLKLNVVLQATDKKHNEWKVPVSFYLENKERENKDFTKKQYINSIGTCTWVDDPNNLPEWFTKDDRPYRVAFVGEEELYNFLRTWLGALDYRDAETVLEIDWKKLMKGNVKELKDQINGEYSVPFVVMATVNVKEDGENVKEYQSVFNKAFLPSYGLKNFRVVDYTLPANIEAVKTKKLKDLKIHEKFIINIIGEYGCKNVFTFDELRDYVSGEHITSSDAVISEEGSDY